MGAWGYGIFEDDLALDIRGEFEDAVNGGATVEEATQAILEGYGEALEDPDEGPVVYLALAALQLERGPVHDSMRQKALGIIDRGESLPLWQDSGEEALAGRKRVLEELRKSLMR